MPSPPFDRRSTRLSFDGGNGFPLAGILDEPTQSPIAAVVFSHCFTCGKDLKMIVRLSRMLAGAGIAVLRYDMTGIGESGGDFSRTDILTNIADVCAASAQLATSFNAPQFLIGHSFGGAASLAATEQVDDVLGTISIAAPTDTYHLPVTLAKLNPELQHADSGSVTIGGRSFKIRREMLDQMRAFDLPSRIAAIRKPLLAFHSPADETVGYWHMGRILPTATEERGDAAERRSVITLPGSDHLFLTNPHDLEFVAEAAVAWIRRMARGS